MNETVQDDPQLVETLVLPSGAKLPPPKPPGKSLPKELESAWIRYMVGGFERNEMMFRRTLDAFIKPYRLTVYIYAALSLIGIGLFLVAAVIGLSAENSLVAIAFAGLGVTSFLAFFVRQPLFALEENLEFITWLGVAFNTYWTRLMYMADPATVQAELKAAEDDFTASIERLIAQHTKVRGGRPSSN